MQKRHRFKQKQSLEERLVQQATRLREEAKALPPGAAREAILGRAEQTETGAQMSQWLRSPGLAWAVSFLGVFIFLGLTAYDTQKLKAYATVPELRGNLAVYGALALYLDFINLFLMLLRLLGGNRR